MNTTTVSLPSKQCICGTNISATSYAEVVELCSRWIAQKRRAQRFHERGVTMPRHDRTRHRSARLTGEERGCRRQGTGGGIEVGVVEDHGGVLAAELEREPTHPLAHD